ncbi:hypothetical protein AGMMS49982_10290 [Bacteroidia bacterium]|nr:hypothetical protein AGMMS49982_10290 [Bacteroidia bacterium]
MLYLLELRTLQKYKTFNKYTKSCRPNLDFDYNTLAPKTINIIPPENIIDLWKGDYETMQRTMIYGNSLPFEKLIEKMKQLNKKINEIEW